MNEQNRKNRRPRRKNKAVKIGDRFGRWTVVGESIKNERKVRKWLCRCECGTERYVLEHNLLTGVTLSCGCLRKERLQKDEYPDLTGRVFGELTVIRKAQSQSSGPVRWLCRCSCGNEVEVPYNELLYSNRKSCGCKRKEHYSKLHSFLTFVAATSVEMLESKKLPSSNTTGYKGVYQRNGKYNAKIVFQNKQYCLGTFENIEDAAAARKKAETELFERVAKHYRMWKEIADRDPEWAAQNPVKVNVEFKKGTFKLQLFPEMAQADETYGT